MALRCINSGNRDRDSNTLMAEKIGELTPEQMASGLWPSVHRSQIPLWETGENVDFFLTGPGKIQGYSSPASPTASGLPIRGMGQLTRSDKTQHLFFGDSASLYRWPGSGVILEEGTLYTGIEDATVTQDATAWSFKDFGDWMIATNGVDTIQVNKGSSFVDLGGVSGAFDTAEIVTALNEHIIVFNTDNSPYEARWAAAGNPELWVPATTNTAGFLPIREARSPIKAAVPLQEAIAVYTKESLFLMEYVGSASFRFRIRHAINGIGAVSKHSVVSVGSFNYGLGTGGFWFTDGNSFKYIDEPAIRDYWRDNLASGQVSKVNAYHNEDEKKIVWYFPTTDEPDAGVAFNYLRNTWTILGFGRTASVERNALTDPHSADNTGALYQDNDTDDAGGSPLTATVTSKGMDLGDASVTKHVQAIRIGYLGSGLLYRIGFKENPEDDSVSWGAYREVISDKYETNYASGKLIYIQFKSEELADAWKLFGVEFYGTVGGSRP